MTLYRIPISYKPKEEKVWRGKCCQTIRPDHGVQPGDELLIYAWSGVPYRSKWKWQKKAKVKSVVNILIFQEGIRLRNWSNKIYSWDSEMCDLIAAEDGIEPATGEALRDVLFKVIGVPGKDGTRCQIIRW